MTIEEVLAYFKTNYQISKLLQMSPHTPANWKKIGYIPADAQARIETYTKGALKFSVNHLKPKDDNQ